MRFPTKTEPEYESLREPNNAFVCHKGHQGQPCVSFQSQPASGKILCGDSFVLQTFRQSVLSII